MLSNVELRVSRPVLHSDHFPLKHPALILFHNCDETHPASGPPPQSRGVWLLQRGPLHRACSEWINARHVIVYETFLLIEINYNHYWTF